MEKDQTLEYQRPAKLPPYSWRAIACFVFAYLCVALLVPAFVCSRDIAERFIGWSPVLGIFSLVCGVWAFSQFPDRRGVRYRGRWMAIAGLWTVTLLLGVLSLTCLVGNLLWPL